MTRNKQSVAILNLTLEWCGASRVQYDNYQKRTWDKRYDGADGDDHKTDYYLASKWYLHKLQFASPCRILMTARIH